MGNVISFRPLPPSPFLGKWLLDPLSVSRNKVVKQTIGEAGLKKLWACGSMEERAQCVADDAELANRYQSVVHLGRKKSLVVTLETICWSHAQGASLPAEEAVLPVMRVAVEGRKVIVHSVETRPGRRGRPLAYVFRRQKQWLLVGERYSGREAQFFPRSPVQRFYRSI
jgi:hypothetical protein